MYMCVDIVQSHVLQQLSCSIPLPSLPFPPLPPQVSIIDAAAVGEVVETFPISSSPIQCIASIPEFDEQDPDVLTGQGGGGGRGGRGREGGMVGGRGKRRRLGCMCYRIVPSKRPPPLLMIVWFTCINTNVLHVIAHPRFLAHGVQVPVGAYWPGTVQYMDLEIN